jgi:hypothetical protein
MFILRAAFWLSVVVLLLPGDPNSGASAPRVSAFEALIAARGAVADVSSFCERNPDVCATGSTALQVFADKVRYGTHLISDYFDGGDEQGADKPATRSTLKREDLAPAWRGHGTKDKPA